LFEGWMSCSAPTSECLTQQLPAPTIVTSLLFLTALAY
jgi:hypothetical protein